MCHPPQQRCFSPRGALVPLKAFCTIFLPLWMTPLAKTRACRYQTEGRAQARPSDYKLRTTN